MGGALAPSSAWIPEDDLLLKNAIEAGASLESLAKGAVRFSRRFTIQELQDRWHCLLYDMDTSVEASARIIEIEIELSVPDHSKSNRTYISKGKEWTPGKRKGDSVRSHYYAMRKRVCNEPCNTADQGFFVPPSALVCPGRQNGCGEQVNPHAEHLIGNCALGTSILNQYGLSEAGFDNGQDAFPEMLGISSDAANADVANHAFYSGNVDSLEGELPDGIAGRDCLYGFVENVSPISVDKTVGEIADRSFEHNNECKKDISPISDENLMTTFQNCSGVQERPPKVLPLSSHYETNEPETKPLNTFDSSNEKSVNCCSNFVGNQNLTSEVTDCTGSFHHLGYSSPLPGMAVWGTLEDISTAPMPDKECGVSAPLVVSIDDNKKMESPGHHGAQSELEFHDGMSDAALNNSTAISEGDFMDLSLNFSNDDELLFIDVDEKDMMDKSCLDGINSILLSSPSDIHQDEVPSSGDPKTKAVFDTCNMISDGACHEEYKEGCNQMRSGRVDENDDCDPAANVLDTCSKIHHFSEPLVDFSCCTLNTEDPEIPCNDDVLIVPTLALPRFAFTNLEHNSEETGLVSSPSKALSNEKKASKQGLAMLKEDQGTFAQPSQSLKNAAQVLYPEVGSMHPSDGYHVKAELLESDSLTGISRHTGIAAGDSSPCTSAPLSAPVSALKEEITSLDMGRSGDFDNTTHSVEESVCAKVCAPKTAVGSEWDADMPGTLQKCVSEHVELGSGEMGFPDPIQAVSDSDQKDQFSDREDDVPNFSDIEAMILDMDLGPYDQESCFFNNDGYQRVDTKKAIIRLEQCANSFMRRAIVSHGAFAILYGRYLKHYIKKPEVSLGRATEGVNVDIDLGREGRANKISRRQAIIKMDGDGLFSLKNTGKCSVLVNGKEVLAGQHFNLSSDCLIEIGGMKFIFEVNHNSVRQHLADVARKSGQELNSKFNWLPSEIS